MPLINCYSCQTPKHYSPSHVPKRAFCSRECYSEIRNNDLMKAGKKTRITGKENFKKTYHYGANHHMWKGEKVGYRGLHRWLQDICGKPSKCLHCGIVNNKPRFIQWANIDKKYRRVTTDYIPLCGSCHKNYDLNYNQ